MGCQHKTLALFGKLHLSKITIHFSSQKALLGKLRLGSIHKTLALSRSEIIVIQLKTFIIGLAPYKSIFLTHPHQANPRAHVQLSSYFYKKFEIFANSIFKMF